MKTVDLLIEHYGSQKAWADAWNVTQGAVCQWVAADDVPIRRLLELEARTGGALVSYLEGGVLKVAKGCPKGDK